jgi:hypothetical protein
MRCFKFISFFYSLLTISGLAGAAFFLYSNGFFPNMEIYEREPDRKWKGKWVI